MLFSCKISNSILNFLENQDEDLSDLLESAPLPEEFLRDSSYWMQAADMESFLRQAQERAAQSSQEGSFFQKVGHNGPELRAWGVLDSVLRMMPRPQEILAQPERFLSYFVSPSPPIDNLRRTENGIEFDLAVSADQYPLTTSFLAYSFESLPLYVGQPLAQCEWKGIHIQIQWYAEQKTIFEGMDLGHQISPDLMRNVLATLEKHSRELEEKNRELQIKNQLLLESQKELEKSLKSKLPLRLHVDDQPIIERSSSSSFHAPVAEELKQQVSRLSDYMVRAQQLITMLIGQDRMSPQVKEAMKRVDWDRVRVQFPQTVEACHRVLSSTPSSEGDHHV